MLWMWTINRGEGHSTVVDNSWKTGTTLRRESAVKGAQCPLTDQCRNLGWPPTYIQLASAALNRIWVVVVTNRAVSNDLILSSWWSMTLLQSWTYLLKQIWLMNIRLMGSVSITNTCKAVSGRTVIRLVPVIKDRCQRRAPIGFSEDVCFRKGENSEYERFILFRNLKVLKNRVN